MGDVPTLGTLIAEGRKFVAQCNTCGRRRTVEPKSFAAPRTMEVWRLGDLMKCANGCKGIIMTWPAEPPADPR